MPIRVLLVSQHFYPEMISTGHILTELLLALSRHEVCSTVVCGQPTYYSRNIVDKHIEYCGINILRTTNTQCNKNAIWGKILNSISFFLLSFAHVLMAEQYTVLLLVTNPPFLGVIGPIIKLLRKRKFILIIHDLYPDMAINFGYMNKTSPLATFWNRLNKWIFREASFVITLGRDVQYLIRRRVDEDHKYKVIYIPNWADPSLIKPVRFDQNPFVKHLGLLEKFVVQYSGNMGLSHDMETIIEAAHELRNHKNIHFLLIGDGGKREKISKKIADYALDNITLLPYQARENLSNSLGACHVSLISLEHSAKGLSVPSKLYGIMASGRASIAVVPEDCEVALTLREYACGLVTRPKDVGGLVRSITWLMTHEKERRLMGEHAREAFLHHFTADRCAEKYLELIRRLP